MTYTQSDTVCTDFAPIFAGCSTMVEVAFEPAARRRSCDANWTVGALRLWFQLSMGRPRAEQGMGGE
jgi:hypothetical protein